MVWGKDFFAAARRRNVSIGKYNKLPLRRCAAASSNFFGKERREEKSLRVFAYPYAPLCATLFLSCFLLFVLPDHVYHRTAHDKLRIELGKDLDA